MARKPRIEFAGAIYHVLNRGNYRQDLFAEPGAAQAFIDCLFEACERMGWTLHAYCLMRNHYHIAIDTPRGNLVEGVHWLQSTFGNRFNRYRGERGRAFQGRYLSILVEPGEHLANLVDYIHLNPVKAGIVTLDQLGQFRWSSYRYFNRPLKERPAFLSCKDWLGVSGLEDSPAGWKEYHKHLEWVYSKDRRPQKESLGRLTHGWVRGSQGFQDKLLAQFKQMNEARDWGGEELRELNQLEWKRLLNEGIRALGFSLEVAQHADKSAAWKVAVATWLKQRTSVSNRWLGENLQMGGPDAVSRYAGECQRGLRKEAGAMLVELTAKVAP